MPPLIADADPAWFRPPDWAIYGGSAVIVGVFVWDRFGGALKAWRKVRAEAKVIEAKADSDAAEAELKPVGTYARIVARLDRRLAAQDEKIDAQAEKIDTLDRQHKDCEDRFKEQHAAMVRLAASKVEQANRIEQLTRTCDAQQRELDTGAATTANLTEKVTRLLALLRANGLTDTGEYTPVGG